MLLFPGTGSARADAKVINIPLHSAFPSQHLYLSPIVLPHIPMLKLLFYLQEILKEGI